MTLEFTGEEIGMMGEDESTQERRLERSERMRVHRREQEFEIGVK